MVFNPLELDEAATPAAVDRRIAAGELAVAITMAAQVRGRVDVGWYFGGGGEGRLPFFFRIVGGLGHYVIHTHPSTQQRQLNEEPIMLKALEAAPATPQGLTLLARTLPATLAPRYVYICMCVYFMYVCVFTGPAFCWQRGTHHPSLLLVIDLHIRTRMSRTHTHFLFVPIID